MEPRIILNSKQFALTIDRLCHQLIEIHKDFAQSAVIGVQPRGIYLAQRIHQRLTEILGHSKIDLGKLDMTFHRDDFRRTDQLLTPEDTDIEFPIEDRNIILTDDVLYTGRTIRSALDALIDFGRPKDVELLVLVDRRLHRHLPIQAKYVGRTVDSISEERVKVEWKEQDGEDKVWIVPSNPSKK